LTNNNISFRTMANKRLDGLSGTCLGSRDLPAHLAHKDFLVQMEVLLEEDSDSHNKLR
jgi:hypothetical protein